MEEKGKKPVRDWVRGVSKTPTGGWGQGHGVFFFPFFFGGGGFIWNLIPFGRKSICRFTTENLLKKLRNKWNCACFLLLAHFPVKTVT